MEDLSLNAKKARKRFSFYDKSSMQEYLSFLLQPYITDAYLSYKKQLAWYPEELSEFELFSRLCLGATFYLSGHNDEELFYKTLEKIDSYIEPSSPVYLKPEIYFTEHSQLNVELFPLLFFLYVHYEKTKDYILLNKQKISAWFSNIFNFDFDNNWVWFQIMANALLHKIGVRDYDRVLTQRLDQKLDAMYIQQGYYLDGKNGSFDYYNHFAFFYYAAIFIKLMSKEEPALCRKYREHIQSFIPIYIASFSNNGRNIPYGRSLLYRFGILAYAGALVYLDEEIIDYGYLKDLIFKSMEEWSSKDIYNFAGFLNCGFYYENDNLLESYNSYGSPYWVFKPFILLLNQNDRFWKTKRKDFSELKTDIILPNGILKQYQGEQFFFPVIENRGYQCTQYCDKYEKNVYSSLFGFNISKGNQSESIASDSSFSISYDGKFFINKSNIRSTIINENIIETDFVFLKTKIKQYQLIQLPFILNIYLIDTDEELVFKEGAYPINDYNLQGKDLDNWTILSNDTQLSAICSIEEYGDTYIEYALPNTNVYYRKTAIPSCISKIQKGKTVHFTEILGCKTLPASFLVPKIQVDKDQIKISFGDLNHTFHTNSQYNSKVSLIHRTKAALKSLKAKISS